MRIRAPPTLEVEVMDGVLKLALKMVQIFEATLEQIGVNHCKIVFTSLKLADPCCNEFGCQKGVSEIWDKKGSESYVVWDHRLNTLGHVEWGMAR